MGGRTKAKDNGTETRDLAEAGLTLILFRGDDPPPPDTNSEEETMPAEEEYEATFAELGEYADDDTDTETAEQAQGLLEEAAAEAGIDPNDYATWTELGLVLQEAKDGTTAEPEEEPEEARSWWARRSPRSRPSPRPPASRATPRCAGSR